MVLITLIAVRTVEEENSAAQMDRTIKIAARIMEVARSVVKTVHQILIAVKMVAKESIAA